MRRYRGTALYAIADYVSAMFSWALFFVARKVWIEGYQVDQYKTFLNDERFYIGIILIPVCWLILYFFTGTYTDVYRKSRISEILYTVLVSAVGVVIIFFTLLIDDHVTRYSDYYFAVAMLFGFHVVATSLGRLLVLNIAKQQIHSGSFGFNTLMVGGDKRAIEVYQDLTSHPHSLGYKFKGFIDTNGNSTNGLMQHLSCIGKMNNLQNVLDDQQIEEVIVAIETSEHQRLGEILNLLASKNVVIKIIPDMYDILSGSVKMNHIMGTGFIEIYPELMARWQYILKRTLDITVSSLVLILLSPLLLFIAIKVKLSSHGPVFYKQERIGLHGKPFTIYKFRSMHVDAEKTGPALSKRFDRRITPWGKVMRKWRLDELPQFWNVLKGEMSLVGPRPERLYYIDQIVEKAPDYKHLQRVQPGITSWGMVKFGYAQNIEEMLNRMKFDLIYIENMSLLLDLKIMLYTVRVIMQGRGK
jgi:exopolysaccharide biosynthesis polyprenyl glycosylphosphotransferase